MNYKILLFLVLLLSSSFILGSNKSNGWKSTTPATASATQKMPNAADPFTWTGDPLQLSHIFQNSDHDSDDSKYVHLHFTRLERRRKRFWSCGMSKGAMILAHAASLLYSLIHIVHY